MISAICGTGGTNGSRQRASPLPHSSAMKHVVSVSLGSSARDKTVEVDLLGEMVRIERIGTDGDIPKAIRLFTELDGQVDALGVGGMDLWLIVGERSYPLYDALRLVQNVKKTPVVDGGGLKETLERRVMQVVEPQIGHTIQPKRALLVAAVARYGMTLSFEQAGYDCKYGDFMFSLGIPIVLSGLRTLHILSALLLPILGRLPMKMLYPTGERQEENVPKYEKWYHWAQVIGGDFLYIKHHLPLDMRGRTIVTNTTTTEDVRLLAERGVRYLVTTTPVLEGRSFGTNVMEAAITAISGKGRRLTFAELDEWIERLDMKPQIQELGS